MELQQVNSSRGSELEDERSATPCARQIESYWADHAILTFNAGSST